MLQHQYSGPGPNTFSTSENFFDKMNPGASFLPRALSSAREAYASPSSTAKLVLVFPLKCELFYPLNQKCPKCSPRKKLLWPSSSLAWSEVFGRQKVMASPKRFERSKKIKIKPI